MYAWPCPARLLLAFVDIFGCLHREIWPILDCVWMASLGAGLHCGMQSGLDWLIATHPGGNIVQQRSMIQ